MISFRNIKTTEDAAQWAKRLDSEWPERKTVIDHICQKVNALPFSMPRVLELCPGHGALASVLLTTQSDVQYVGIDSSSVLTLVATDVLSPFDDRASLIEADLNADTWLNLMQQPFHAIVSMQSLHDLGDEAAVNRVYQLSKDLLVPGGLFLNADLIVPIGEDKPNNPGRRSIPRHLELLQSHGYERVVCSLEVGEFGCCVGYRP